MSRPRIPKEEKLIPVGTALPLKLLEEIEQKAKEHDISVSSIVRNILLSSLDVDTSSFLAVDISPETKSGVIQLSKKLEISLDKAVDRMLQGSLTIAKCTEDQA